MRYIVCSLMLLNIACQQQYQSLDPRSIHGIDQELVPYLNMYLKVKGSSLHYDIPIRLVKLDILGRCTSWSNDYRQIVINKDYWKNPTTTETAKIALIFHELGHCDLNRRHTETLLSDGKPASLMYPYNIPYLPLMEEYYFDELFIHPIN